MNRHPQIKNVSEIEGVQSSHGKKFSSTRKRLAANAGSKDLGCSWFEIPPGHQAFPHHYHFNNEEAFFILSGSGEVRIGDERYPISAGDYIACPTNEESAHSMINTGNEPLRYLAISTANQTDIMMYPDSKKIFLAGGADMHKGLKSAKFAKTIKDQPGVDYYEGEE